MISRLLLPLFLSLALWAQPVPIENLHIEKKLGAIAGPVMGTVKGKVKKIYPNAVQVFDATGDQAGLLVILPPVTAGSFPVRFFDTGTGKGHTLGTVPFSEAKFTRKDRPNDTPLFLLEAKGQLVIADETAIRARIPGATAANEFDWPKVLGEDRTAIYRVANEPKHVQFLRDGSAVELVAGQAPVFGRWYTDGAGTVMEVPGRPDQKFGPNALTPALGIPAGTRLVVRLAKPLASNTTKAGDAVEGVLITPARVDGKIFIPSGSKVLGTVTKANAVGFGLRRETAILLVDFTKVVLPGGTTLAIPARLEQVENSREKVNEKGEIIGIRSTGTLGHSAKSQINALAGIDPIGYVFTSVAGTATLGFTEPEILYPAGTELVVSLTSPVLTETVFASELKLLTSTEAEEKALRDFVRQLPFRTATQVGNKPSDLTNLLFVGPVAGLQRAFAAAGWSNVAQLNATSGFQTLKSMAGDQGYREAPMSTLLLDERAPIYTLSKTTNTFSSRHHLRVFDPAQKFNGMPVLTSSSTQDIGIAFSRKKKTFIHVIDEYIDNERAKVVNDLTYTGCVDAVELVPRPWLPTDAYNSTGDRLRTDRAIAVLKINDCQNPVQVNPAIPPAPALWQRSVRNTMLTLRNDVWRGNLVYQGVTGAMKVKGFLAKDGEMKVDPGAWRKADIAGAKYEGYGDLPASRARRAAEQPAVAEAEESGPDQKWAAPHYEIGIQAGYLRFTEKTMESVGILLKEPGSSLPSAAIGLVDSVDNGWTLGGTITLNRWRWVSSEFGYFMQRGTYSLNSFVVTSTSNPDDLAIESNSTGLVTRQFAYNMLFHARPRESRWRPYFAAGPALQLIHLSEAPLKKAPPAFKLGLQNIGLLKAAFDFGRTPPLDGGGIFQVGLQYGGGIKFRVTPRLMLRADFRETWSRNPNIIRDSYEEAVGGVGIDYDVIRIRPTAKFRQQRITMGVSYTF